MLALKISLLELCLTCVRDAFSCWTSDSNAFTRVPRSVGCTMVWGLGWASPGYNNVQHKSKQTLTSFVVCMIVTAKQAMTDFLVYLEVRSLLSSAKYCLTDNLVSRTVAILISLWCTMYTELQKVSMYNICNGWGMPTGEGYSTRKEFPSHLGLAFVLFLRPVFSEFVIFFEHPLVLRYY